MSRLDKLLKQVIWGSSDANIAFQDLVKLLYALGFRERIKGSHHIFFRQGVEEILNIQARGKMAKPYQVKQVRQILLKYKLGVDSDD
jgi:predicted RNA binding protein YcfA (HicA-like mRNA interferase family)